MNVHLLRDQDREDTYLRGFEFLPLFFLFFYSRCVSSDYRAISNSRSNARRNSHEFARARVRSVCKDVDRAVAVSNTSYGLVSREMLLSNSPGRSRNSYEFFMRDLIAESTRSPPRPVLGAAKRSREKRRGPAPPPPVVPCRRADPECRGSFASSGRAFFQPGRDLAHSSYTVISPRPSSLNRIHVALARRP